MKRNNKNVKFSFIFGLAVSFFFVFCVLTGLGILAIQIAHKLGYNYHYFNPIALFFIFISCSLLLGTLFAYIINKNMIKEMDQIRNILADVAKGDFSKKLPICKKNSIFNETYIDFNRMIDELNSNAILKEDFISNFSHEFKTPIVSIKGYAELLLIDDTIPLEDKKKYLNIIIDESRRLSNLSQQTMALSKLDSKAIIEHLESVDINAQIDEAILVLDKAFKEKNIEIKIKEGPRLFFKGNKNMLVEVWINILNNAIKFSNQNGLVDISFSQNEEYYIVSIRDNGVGMDEDTKRHIFDKYFQGDKSHNSEGIGLGLAICNRIVTLHHGKIEVETVPQKGSLFNVYLPKETV